METFIPKEQAALNQGWRTKGRNHSPERFAGDFRLFPSCSFQHPTPGQRVGAKLEQAFPTKLCSNQTWGAWMDLTGPGPGAYFWYRQNTQSLGNEKGFTGKLCWS